MEQFKRGLCEVLLSAAAATVASLFAAALFAVFVRAYAPSEITITVCNQAIKCAVVFLGAMLFVRRDRALFKGAAAGVVSLLFTALVFGVIGGFDFNVFFLAELLLSALFGGCGALCGVKLRKE